MKAAAQKYGQVGGKMKGPQASAPISAETLAKGMVMQQTENNEASDEDSKDMTVDASETAGLPKESAPAVHAMPMNLLSTQSPIHEAAGFVAKRDY